MLAHVDNPTAYGLVETDPEGNVLRFIEKPSPDEITTTNINAAIYVLEPTTLLGLRFTTLLTVPGTVAVVEPLLVVPTGTSTVNVFV